jgi:hypothetical protein
MLTELLLLILVLLLFLFLSNVVQVILLCRRSCGRANQANG